MMRRILLPACSVAVLLAVPAGAGAAAPSPVAGIEAKIANGRVIVSWDSPRERDIAFYRIYYSTESILENDGLFDDFEETLGPSTERALQFEPLSPKLYISVLAVNREGEEGEFFAEEATVVVRGEEVEDENTASEEAEEGEGREAVEEVEEVEDDQEADGAQDVPEDVDVETAQPEEAARAEEPEPESRITSPEPEPPEDPTSTLHLLLVDVLSQTELELMFSARPVVSPPRAPEAFGITDQFGRTLPISSIVIDGRIVRVHTVPHVPGAIYKLQLSEPLVAADGAPLDSIDQQSYFLGYQGPPRPPADIQLYPPPGYEQTAPPALPVRNLRLRAQAAGRGVHNVSAVWEVNPQNAPQAFVVRQSIDGGRTFSPPETLPGETAGIEIPGVTSALYGLGIRTVAVDGGISDEAFENIELPGGIPVPPVAVAPVRSQPPPSPPSSSPAQPVLNDQRVTPDALQSARTGGTGDEKREPRGESRMTNHALRSTRLAQTGAGMGAALFAAAAVALRRTRSRRAV